MDFIGDRCVVEVESYSCNNVKWHMLKFPDV